jgi:hypothetical protein
MDQFPKIARQIKRSGTGVGEDIPGILVGDIGLLVFLVPIFNVLHIICEASFVDGGRSYKLESVLGAVPLAPLSEAAMSMSHQLMGTGSGDAFNLEGEIDVFKHTVMTVFVEVFNQTHRVLGIAVIADRRNLRHGFHRVRGGLNQCDFHN